MQCALLCADCSRLACTADQYFENLNDSDEPIYLLQCPLRPSSLKDRPQCIGHIDTHGGVHLNSAIFPPNIEELAHLAKWVISIFIDASVDGPSFPMKQGVITMIWLITFRYRAATIMAFLQLSNVGGRLLFYGSPKKKHAGKGTDFVTATSDVSTLFEQLKSVPFSLPKMLLFAG